MTSTLASPSVGQLVREWRKRRHRSQMELALDAGLSARHLSFVETGRSRPSPELLMSLANELDVPLRERNTLMLAAGYAPRYSHTPLDNETMTTVRAALQQLLDGHQPYPGVVIDRCWDVVQANDAALRLSATLPAELTAPAVNVFRACLHPQGFAPYTLNLDDWGSYLVGQLRRLKDLTNDPAVHALCEEVEAYPTVQALRPAREERGPALIVPWELQIDSQRLSLFTTLTTFGTPRDITLDELAVELFYPADDETARALRLPGR